MVTDSQQRHVKQNRATVLTISGRRWLCGGRRPACWLRTPIACQATVVTTPMPRDSTVRLSISVECAPQFLSTPGASPGNLAVSALHRPQETADLGIEALSGFDADHVTDSWDDHQP